MFRRRTTPPAATNRPRLAICALILFASAGYAAEPGLSPLQITLQAAPTGGVAGPAQQIVVSGRAPARCAPELARVNLDGTDLNIRLKTPHTACDAQHMLPFALRIDPARDAGMPLLPGQVYRTRVYSGDDGGAHLLAFHLLDTSARASAPLPESGFWWSEASAEAGAASAATGLSIEAQDGKIAIGLLGFADNGAATWSFGSGPSGGRTAVVSMVQLANGDPTFTPTGARPSAQAGPRLEIEFVSPTRARAWLVRSDAGRDVEVRVLSIARSRFSTGPLGSEWSGQWVLVPDDNGAPRMFEFADPSSLDAENFHLDDAGNGAALDCRVAHGTQHPELCTLSVAATTLADFDQIGLDHLSGRDGGGVRVQLLRVPR
ncbi:MAG: hypothetical protein ACHP7D_01450 [Lysobacterales bacterium]